MNTLVIALLFALVSPVEQTYGPYPRPARGARQAVAAGGTGVLLAWSEDSTGARIRVGLLDSRGRLISPITILPAVANTSDAYAPAISFNGESFLVVWVERNRGRESIRGARFDAAGVPIGAARTYDSSFTFPETVVAPNVVWDGRAWRVWARAHTYEILPTGEPGTRPEAPQPQAVAVRNGILGTASAKLTPLYRNCFLFRCERYGDKWDVVWTDGEEQGTKGIGGDWPVDSHPVSAPGIAVAGDEFVVAWTSEFGVGYLLTRTTQSSANVLAKVKLDVPPGLACDDERCVVAFGTTGGDVQAIVFDVDQLHSPELHVIAATERKEHGPQVHFLGSGRFLVSYFSDQGGDARLNGRVLTLDPVRRRAVR
jgi:hypothetical protein